MKEIPREKRLEIARCCLLGYSYAEIEAQTGASHGTVANIVHELESGKLSGGTQTPPGMGRSKSAS